MLDKYNPHITWSSQTVRLKVLLFDYQTTIEVTVGGNCKGSTILQGSVNNAYNGLPYREIDGKQIRYVTLHRQGPEPGTLLCEDEDLIGASWLADMVVGMEIIRREPYTGKRTAVDARRPLHFWHWESLAETSRQVSENMARLHEAFAAEQAARKDRIAAAASQSDSRRNC